MRNPGVRRVAVLMLPIAVGAIATRINVAVDNTIGARMLAEGGLSALYYANVLAQVPNLTFTTALTVALFPFLAQNAALNEFDTLRRRAALSVRLNMFVLIPSAVAFVVLGRPIVALMLQRGAFSAGSTDQVYGPLAMLAVGIAAQASIFLVVRVFYSLQQVVTPMLISLAAVAVNLAASYTLVRPLGAAGLALGTSLASILNFTLLTYFVRRHIGGFEIRALGRCLAQALASAAVMGFVCFYTWPALAGGGPLRLDARHYLAMAAVVVIGAAVYMGCQFALRSEEARVTVRVLLRRDLGGAR
jgi:putative peptidoglycan lipid II flippase